MTILLLLALIGADRAEIAAEAALADAVARDTDPHYTRWVWVRSPESDDHKAAIFVLGTSVANTKRGAVIPEAVSLGMKAGVLLRLDIYRYTPRQEDRERLFGKFDGKRWIGGLWEGLADVEPNFLALRRLDDAKIIALPTVGQQRIEITDPAVLIKSGTTTLGTAMKGETFVRSGTEGEWTLIDFPSGGTVVRGWVKSGFKLLPAAAGPVPPPSSVPVAKFIRVPNVHCEQDYTELQTLTGSAVPVVEFTWLMRSLWWTNEGPTDGTLGIKGQYYEWRGIRKANAAEIAAGKTDFDVFCDSFGADWKEADKEGALARVVLSESEVTNKPRRLDFFRGRKVHPTKNQGIVSASFDPSNRTVADPQFDATRLLDGGLKFNGIEAIGQDEQGVRCAAFNDKFELVRVVPQDIADDDTKQRPQQGELEAFGSCFFCHNRLGEKGKKGESFWKSFKNEGPEILQRFGVKDPLQRDRLESLYGENTLGIDDLLEQMRVSYSQFAVEVSDTQPFDLAERLRPWYGKFWYAGVDEKAALFDLGIDDEKVRLEDVLLPVDVEDAVIDRVLAGKAVHREAWLGVLGDVIRREWLLRQKMDE